MRKYLKCSEKSEAYLEAQRKPQTCRQLRKRSLLIQCNMIYESSHKIFLKRDISKLTILFLMKAMGTSLFLPKKKHTNGSKKIYRMSMLSSIHVQMYSISFLKKETIILLLQEMQKCRRSKQKEATSNIIYRKPG